MDLTQAIEHALSGDALLFLGAGFSIQAINCNNENMSDSKRFSNILCDKMGVKSNDDLSRVANLYLKKNSPVDLVELLKREFSCKEVSEAYKTITDVNWNRVYTTNYDDVFEFASRLSGKVISSLTLSSEPNNYNKRASVTHINGFIGTLTAEKLNNEFKLSTSSYNTSDFSKSRWAGLFRNDLNNAKAIIFIGTSLSYDIDLKRIINSNPVLKSKIIFIDKESDKSSVDIYELDAKDDFGYVEYIGLGGFVERIKAIKKTYTASGKKQNLESFELLNSKKYKYSTSKVEDVWQLLVHGEINEEIIQSNAIDDTYVIEREDATKIIDLVQNNQKQIFVIHSDLGNGKSCFVVKLAYMLTSLGNVFIMRNSRYVAKELEVIDTYNGKKILIIENYHDNWHLIDLIKDYLNDDYKLILTARSYIHETRIQELESKFKDLYINEFDINRLKSQDINKLIPLLSRIEPWQEFHNSDESTKRKLITRKYDSKMCNILIDMLKSKNIQAKINDIYNSIIEISNLKELLIAACINSVVDLTLSAYDLVELLEINDFSTIVKTNVNVRTIINWDDNQIRIKSPIIARYLLRESINDYDVINTIKNMVSYANRYDFDYKYSNVSKKLISVSNIWLLLNQSDKSVRDAVIELFDSLKDFPNYSDKPFFWLQYAIACLDNELYERSKVYFDLSYQKSKGMSYDFDNFQIDTHYARYLIVNAIKVEKKDENCNTFQKAHNLLIKSLGSPKQIDRYVLRQVSLYYDYWTTFKSNMNTNEKNIMLRLTKSMLEKITAYKLIHQNNTENYIIEKKDHLEKIVIEILQSVTIR